MANYFPGKWQVVPKKATQIYPWINMSLSGVCNVLSSLKVVSVLWMGYWGAVIKKKWSQDKKIFLVIFKLISLQFDDYPVQVFFFLKGCTWSCNLGCAPLFYSDNTRMKLSCLSFILDYTGNYCSVITIGTSKSVAKRSCLYFNFPFPCPFTLPPFGILTPALG